VDKFKADRFPGREGRAIQRRSAYSSPYTPHSGSDAKSPTSAGVSFTADVYSSSVVGLIVVPVCVMKTTPLIAFETQKFTFAGDVDVLHQAVVEHHFRIFQEHS
jgi:hypothetical protein